MTPTFESQVLDALEAISHGGDCASHIMAFGSSAPVMACDCDREQRIAQRVAAAIEVVVEDYAAVCWAETSAPKRETRHDAWDAALQALRGNET